MVNFVKHASVQLNQTYVCKYSNMYDGGGGM